jgi:prolipoprotein diacylglyceryltransferase
MSFVLVGILISGLYALTCMPYCPPLDMRLGIEKQLNVWDFILLLSVVEIVIGVRLTFILLSGLSYQSAYPFMPREQLDFNRAPLTRPQRSNH